MTELKIPDLGEGVDEGVVLAVLVEVGAAVAEGQALLEVETDKVTFEIPSPRDGVIEELQIEADAVIKAGDIFARMSFDANGSIAVPADDFVEAPAQVAPTMPESTGTHASKPDLAPPPALASGDRLQSGTVVRAGPAARREARELGITIAEVTGTGRRDRITKEDVRQHARRLLTIPRAAESPALPDLSAFGPVHEVPMSRLDRTIARNMTQAATEIPHSWISQTADITALETRRREVRASQTEADAPLTLTAILCKIIGSAMVEYPRFNAGIDTRAHVFVYRDYVNVGVAVDAERALYVPVIKDVPSLSIMEVAAELGRVSAAARENRIAGADLRGGGITITNLGGIGVSAMQPIINPPEVAILGISSAADTLVKQGDDIATRLRMPLTLGFDHRVINGAEAARFINFVCDQLSTPENMTFDG